MCIKALLFLFTPCIECCGYANCLRIPIDREERKGRIKESPEQQFHRSDAKRAYNCFVLFCLTNIQHYCSCTNVFKSVFQLNPIVSWVSGHAKNPHSIHVLSTIVLNDIPALAAMGRVGN